MQIISAPTEMQNIALQARREGKIIGVVPTMGYLHNGHISLVKKAKSECDIVITTIFVNKLQFAPHEDFEKYPRNLQQDSDLAKSAGSDFIFHPTTEAMYPAGFSTRVQIGGITEPLEGTFRPGHFDGVATVVAKLLLLTVAERAYFGLKDFQQCMVIKRLVSDLNIPVNLYFEPTVREEDGLALSSRNVYLSEEERQHALSLSKALAAASDALRQGERRTAIVEDLMRETILRIAPLANIEYASAVEPETLRAYSDEAIKGDVALLLAVKIGATRLIDNQLIKLTT